MDGWNGEKKLLDQRLADPALYAGSADSAQLQTLLKRQAELATMIDEGELRWLDIQDRARGDRRDLKRCPDFRLRRTPAPAATRIIGERATSSFRDDGARKAARETFAH